MSLLSNCLISGETCWCRLHHTASRKQERLLGLAELHHRRSGGAFCWKLPWSLQHCLLMTQTHSLDWDIFSDHDQCPWVHLINFQWWIYPPLKFTGRRKTGENNTEKERKIKKSSSSKTDEILTPRNPNTIKSHYDSLYNMKKSDYVITGRPIWVQKRWPGSITGVMCYGCSQVWVQEVTGSNPGGTPPFWRCQYRVR